jgi:hypothetical protein
MDLKQYLELLKKDYQGLRLYPSANVIPTKEIVLKVDVEKVKRLGIVPKELESLIVPEMRLRVKANGLEKKDLAMLDLLSTSDWERPLYVNNTSLAQFNVDLQPFVIQEGNAYRILPIVNPNPQAELVNTDTTYYNITKKFQYRGLDDPSIYYTQDYRSFVQNHRSSINSLAEALIAKGDQAKAREVLLFSLTKMPDKGIRYDFTSARTAELLFEVGENDKAKEMINVMAPRAQEQADYYVGEGEFGRELQINIVILGELQRALYKYGESEMAKKLEDAYNKYYDAFQQRR